MKLLHILAAVTMFTGIPSGCLALLLLVILMVRFSLLLVAVLLTCWIVSWLLNAREKLSQ